MRTPLKILLWSALCCLAGAAAARPTVIASIHPYADLLRQIAGERAEVVRLLDPGSSPHTYDPSPRAVARIAEADLVVFNGGLDEWLLDLVRASGTRAPVFEALAELEFEPIGSAEEGAGSGGERTADAHDHAGVNPHIWLDPVLVARLVPRLAEALAQVDPAGAQAYGANARNLVAELEALDAELARLLEPLRGAPFVPFHDAWPYFARRYGLDLVIELEPAPGREPSPSYVAGAIELIRESGARAVFGELQLPARPAQVVAENAGVALFTLDPLGGGETESYQDLLRFNARRIVEALGE